MRDNTDMTDLTKLDTKTEFQPERGFKRHRENATICEKLRGMLMGFSLAAPYPSSIFDSNKIEEELLAIGRSLFSHNSGRVNELELTNFVGMPKSKKAAQNIAKVLKTIINNWFVKTNWTLDDYEELVKERQNNPAFEPVG